MRGTNDSSRARHDQGGKSAPCRLGRWLQRAPGGDDVLDVIRGSAASKRFGKMKTQMDALREASELLTIATQTLIALGGAQATAATLEDLAWRCRHGMFLTGKQAPPRLPAGHA